MDDGLLNEDNTDRAARLLVERLPDADVFDIVVGLRLIRTGQLVAASWGATPTTSVERLAAEATPHTLVAARHALRYLSDLDVQDLVELLRAVTIGLGDLPASDRSHLPNEHTNPKGHP